MNLMMKARMKMNNSYVINNPRGIPRGFFRILSIYNSIEESDQYDYSIKKMLSQYLNTIIG